MSFKKNESEPKTARAGPAYEWDSDTALARIKEISQNARSTWFGLLALMTFVLVTLLGVQDIDFFGYGRFTQLPLVNVQVPTELFFWAAPPLAAATYAYFHFYLLRLWDALGRAPAKHQGDPFSEHVYPWLLTDAALRRRKDSAAQRRALGTAAALTSLLITWLFGLIVLFFAWWRSLVAHDPALSILTLACLLFAGTAGMTSWVMLHRRVERRIPGPVARNVWRGWRRRGGRRVVVFLVLVTVLKTWSGHPGVSVEYEGRVSKNIIVTSTMFSKTIKKTLPNTILGFDIPFFDIPENSLMANANLTGTSITVRPDNWLSRPLAELEARRAWCQRQGISWPLCVKPPLEEHHAKARMAWCKDHLDTDQKTPCDAHFSKREEGFQAEWKERRAAYLAILKKPNLKRKDLRAATLVHAFLPGADLSGARMNDANLAFAEMEGANLHRARLDRADLSSARLAGADLRGARLGGADLSEARLEGADFSPTPGGANFKLKEGKTSGGLTWLEGANLSAARLEGANFNQALLMRANLSLARLERANLSWAELGNANLSKAWLNGADLNNAKMEGVNLSYARIQNTNLMEAQLNGANLNSAWLEGADLRGALFVRASLNDARLDGADLRSTELQGADLRGASLRSAQFGNTEIGPSLLSRADFTGAKDLTQSQLEGAIGDEHTILPAQWGQPLYVWSCWIEPPYKLDAILKAHENRPREPFKKDWLCATPADRVKTGRTADE